MIYLVCFIIITVIITHHLIRTSDSQWSQMCYISTAWLGIYYNDYPGYGMKSYEWLGIKVDRAC